MFIIIILSGLSKNNYKLSKVSVHNSTQPVLQKRFIDKPNIYLRTQEKAKNSQQM